MSGNEVAAEPISRLDTKAFSTDVKVLLTDLDDTITTDGKLHAEPYKALWDLQEAGIKVILVTGRPAGWCDMIARFWPVDAVVGENGGFYYFYDGSRLRSHYMYSSAERAEFRSRLTEIRDVILSRFPGVAISTDQNFREYDLAVDFCEDVPPVPAEDVLKIKETFEEFGATAKISSIHVNGWFGEFDKLSTSILCMEQLFSIPRGEIKWIATFCGDSPNDEPMFDYFPWSFGMANVKKFLEIMHAHPTYITSYESGNGFCEVVSKLIG